MKQIIKTSILLFLLPLVGLAQPNTGADSVILTSPTENFIMTFKLSDGIPTYQLSLDNQIVINNSELGLELKEGESLFDNFSLSNTVNSTFDEIWQPLWGETRNIRHHYNELAVTLIQQGSDRQMIIRFRLFDDGLGFGRLRAFTAPRSMAASAAARRSAGISEYGILPVSAGRFCVVAFTLCVLAAATRSATDRPNIASADWVF